MAKAPSSKMNNEAGRRHGSAGRKTAERDRSQGGRSNPEKAPARSGAGNPGRTEEAESHRRFRRVMTFCYAVVGFLAICLAAATPFVLYRHVRYSCTVELGEGLPDMSVYFREASQRTIRCEDPPEISLTEPGRYRLTLSTPWGTRRVWLIVKDTLPPTAEDGKVSISQFDPEGSLAPEAALINVREPSGYTAEWVTAPAYGVPGVHNCAVRLTDSLGHSAVVSCTVNVTYPCVGAVADKNGDLPAPEEYFSILPAGEITYLDTSAVNMAEYGEYPVRLRCGGIEFDSTLTLRDITPPSAVAVSQTTYDSCPLEAAAFVTKLIDNCGAEQVTVSYLQEPDWSVPGEQSVSLRLADGAGNEATLESSVTVLADTVAPRLRMPTDRYLYINEAVRYFEGITVSDNADPSITVSVDHSAVNMRQAGDYPVIYTATDSAGNSSSVTVMFHFQESSVDEEELRERGREILNRILKPGMKDAEKAWAIFDYAYRNVAYSLKGVTHTDWRYAAEWAIRFGGGDCYSSASLCYLLLTEAGFDVIIAEHYYEEGYNHFWNLVNLGTGWYHLDATHLNTSRVDYEWCFMRTEDEVKAHPFGDHYWGMDEDKYPAISNVPFDFER